MLQLSARVTVSLKKVAGALLVTLDMQLNLNAVIATSVVMIHTAFTMIRLAKNASVSLPYNKCTDGNIKFLIKQNIYTAFCKNHCESIGDHGCNTCTHGYVTEPECCVCDTIGNDTHAFYKTTNDECERKFDWN